MEADVGDRTRYFSISPADVSCCQMPELNVECCNASQPPLDVTVFNHVHQSTGGTLNKTLAINNLLEENRRLSHMLGCMRHDMSAKSSVSRIGYLSQDLGKENEPVCYSCIDRDSRIKDLTSQLGKSEYNEKQLSACIENMTSHTDVKIKETEETINILQTQLTEFANKNNELQRSCNRMKQEKDKLLAYQSTLLTREQHAQLQSDLSEALDKKEKLKNKLRSVNQSNENLKTADKANQRMLLEKNQEIDNIKCHLEKSEKNLKTLELFVKNDPALNGELPHVTIANLELQVNDLSSELKKYKKLVKEQRNTARTDKKKFEDSIKTLEEEVSRLTQLNEQTLSDHKEMKLEYRLIKTSLEELSQETCFVKQERDAISDELQQIKQLQLGEKFKTNIRVSQQLKQCISEMNTFINIMRKFKQDKELDFSLLLESHSPAKRATKSSSASELSLQDEVTALQTEMKKMRNDISDYAAADIGNDCIIQ